MQTLNSYLNKPEVIEAMKKKQDERKEKCIVERDVELKINGKDVKLSLPNDTRRQLYIVTLANGFIEGSLKNESLEVIYDTQVKIFEFVAKNILVDGKEVGDVNELEYEDIFSYAIVYIMELALPLFHGGGTRAVDGLDQILKRYMK